MQLLNDASAKELIEYAKDLVGGEYGESVDICFSQDILCCSAKDFEEKNTEITVITVCGYVAYLLGIGLTIFPGCSEKDRHKPHKISPETIQGFKKRTAYVLCKNFITTAEKQGDILAT